jgi:hypothetical protein
MICISNPAIRAIWVSCHPRQRDRGQHNIGEIDGESLVPPNDALVAASPETYEYVLATAKRRSDLQSSLA